MSWFDVWSDLILGTLPDKRLACVRVCAEPAAAALCPTLLMSEILCYKWKPELAHAHWRKLKAPVYFGTYYLHDLLFCLSIANMHEE